MHPGALLTRLRAPYRHRRPWTIPANLAVAVNGKLDYAVVTHPALPYRLVVAEALVGSLRQRLSDQIPEGEELQIAATFKGDDLVGGTACREGRRTPPQVPAWWLHRRRSRLRTAERRLRWEARPSARLRLRMNRSGMAPPPGTKYKHPLLERESAVVAGGDYITTESGTGLVHTAPGHGQDDYITGLKCAADPRKHLAPL